MRAKITADHLERTALVYVRQSTPGQVRDHTESRRRQYGLVDVARELGFHRVETIDDDLGLSGSGFVRVGIAVIAGVGAGASGLGGPRVVVGGCGGAGSLCCAGGNRAGGSDAGSARRGALDRDRIRNRGGGGWREPHVLFAGRGVHARA